MSSQAGTSSADSTVTRLPQEAIDQTSRDRRSSGPPAWPLVWVLVGYPLWWALGLGPLVFPLVAAPMAFLLIRHRPIRTPKGFGWWLLFLVWVVGSLAMLGVNPPGIVAEPASSRLFVAMFRLVQYLTITVFLLYVVNLRREVLSNRRIAWFFGLVFVYAIVGGWIATIWPHFEFTSPVEFLLPESVRRNLWVASMVHPSAAQVQNIIGFELGRPAAPFGFTNTWGGNVALLAPWFVVAWVIQARGRARLAGIAILVAALVPIVLSVNRGLWIALIVAAVGAILLALVSGRRRVALPILSAGLVAVAMVALSPLGTTVQGRLDNPHSNSVRTFTSEKAIEVSRYSPVLGLGSSRKAIGSAQSVAVGKTPLCPRCGNTPLGQNGQIFMVLVGQGIVGLVLFYGMFIRGIGAAWRPRDLITAAAGLSLLTGFVLTIYYDMLLTPVLFWALGLGVLWREGVDRD